MKSSHFLDADGTVFFARELESVKARSYDVKYAQLKYRSLWSVSMEAGAGATSVTYRTYDQVGMAKIINNYAEDLPNVDVAGKETTAPIKTLADSFGYSIKEIKSSQMTGKSLDQRRANMARRAIEQLANGISFNGDAASGLQGLFSNPNIPTGPVANGAGGTPAWASKTPDEILFDINDAFADVMENTKDVESAKKLLLPIRQWNYIMSTPRASNSDTTIAQFIAANSPHLTSLADIEWVNELEAAVEGDDVMVVYDPSPDISEIEIPEDITFQPEQRVNLMFKIPVTSEFGGLNVYYPLAYNIKTGI